MATDHSVDEMTEPVDPTANYQRSAELIGYVPRLQATPATYTALGFKCGLEIHQQLLTRSKLFCRCPAGRYHDAADFDAEVIRHMRPTLSEMGEYDGTALMEKKTRKNITYRLKNETACTYEVDDTPPFIIDRQALEIAIEVALLLKTNVVGELHITRKQYLDGSIPTGFQRTAIVGIEGEIPLKSKRIRIIQISIEEDSCREVSDMGHERIYITDRLGMPLIESVTYPEMLTPDEAAEAAQYLRFLVRSTGHVRTGIGAARQDVNVSITGGTRVEIKGVAHIKWIPELTHNEMFRQRALLVIAQILRRRVADPSTWRMHHADLDWPDFPFDYPPWEDVRRAGARLVAVTLPDFRGLLSFFTQPGHSFADEIAGRLKVIACLERPNLLHSEQADSPMQPEDWSRVRSLLPAGSTDALLLIWGPPADIVTALETIEERCKMAFEGVPNETRKSLPDGTTIFERVLPGPDRMYPDTDSAPLPIREELIERIRQNLPREVAERSHQLARWKVPQDTVPFILRRNLGNLIERVVTTLGYEPVWVATVLGHLLRNIEGRSGANSSLLPERLYNLFAFVHSKGLDRDILKAMLPLTVKRPELPFDDILTCLDFHPQPRENITKLIPALLPDFRKHARSSDPGALVHWLMGRLRPIALGNIPLAELRTCVEKEVRS